MIFIYDYEDYREFLKDFAQKGAGVFDGKTLNFSPHIADGYLKLIEIPDGLQIIISNYTANSDIVYKRITSVPEIFTLRIDYAEMSGGSVSLEGDSFSPAVSVYANILMTSSRLHYKIAVTKGTKIKSVSIILKPSWLQKYFPFKTVNYWLKYAHALRLNGINRVPLDFEARESLFALIDLSEKESAYLFQVQVRIYELADYYYKQIIRQKDLWGKKEVLLIDISKIIELDVYLNRNFEQLANLPDINEMATFSNMSPSKLKSLFKKLYNQSISEYFNACRLNNARKMLLLNERNIKEVSAKFGYHSVQHFTTAFKKQFGNTPAAMLKNAV